MRKMFRGYYYPTEAEFSELWEKGIFIFDANILLNIYRYSDDTRELFIKILTEISERIIIPHQAAKEYQENRLNVIRDQKNAYDKVITNLQSEFKKIETDLNSYKRHPSINREEIIKDLDNTFKKIINDLKNKDESHPDLFKKDDLRDKLTVLLDGKISKPCPKNQKEKIWKAGKDRYNKKVPPGYKDEKDKDGFKKCGDLILWYQIIDIAKKMDPPKPIILVTDDKKEDWWWESGGKTIGPRHELVEEICEEAGVLFYMYKTDNFIKRAEKKFFNIDTDPSVIQEVKDAMSESKQLNKYWDDWDLDKSSKILFRSPISPYIKEDQLQQILLNIEEGNETFQNNIFLLESLVNNYKTDILKKRTRLTNREQDMIELMELINNTNSRGEFKRLDMKLSKIKNEIKQLSRDVAKSEREYDTLKNLLDSTQRINF